MKFYYIFSFMSLVIKSKEVKIRYSENYMNKLSLITAVKLMRGDSLQKGIVWINVFHICDPNWTDYKAGVICQTGIMP